MSNKNEKMNNEKTDVVQNTEKKTKKHSNGLWQRFKNYLFSNNKTLMLFSLVIAIISWMFFSQTATDNVMEITLNDVPITIQLSDEALEDGLQVFTRDNLIASVKVSGNRLNIGRLTKDDVSVVGTVSGGLTFANNYTLTIDAKKNSASANIDFDIVSCTPRNMNVYIDRSNEKEYPVIYDTIKMQVDDTYFTSTIPSPDKVTISGPAEKIKEIGKVNVITDLTDRGTLTESINFTDKLVVYDQSGDEMDLEQNFLTLSVESVEVNVEIMPKKELRIIPSFENFPSGIAIDEICKVSLDTISVAGPADVLEDLETVRLEAIDFRTLSNKKHTFTMDVELPQDCKNISSITSVDVIVDLSEYEVKTFKVSDFKVKNSLSNLNVKVDTSEIEVKVVAPKGKFDDLEEANIEAIVDMKGRESLGTMSVPLTFNVNDIDGAWVTGIDYEVTITVTADE